MYKNVQELTGDINKSDSAGIKSKNVKLLAKQTEVLSRWSKYTGELDDNRGEKPEITEEMNGPPVLKSEVEFVLPKIKAGKQWDQTRLLLK